MLSCIFFNIQIILKSVINHQNNNKQITKIIRFYIIFSQKIKNLKEHNFLF